jgi:hypothetical protein
MAPISNFKRQLAPNRPWRFCFLAKLLVALKRNRATSLEQRNVRDYEWQCSHPQKLAKVTVINGWQ